MEEQISVENYNLLIHKLAWKYARRWNVDETEMYAEGLYIFVLTLNKFEKKRGYRFSTYLYNRLQGKLDKYGKRERERIRQYFSYSHPHPLDKLPLDRFPANDWDNWYDLFIRRLEFYETISTELSEDAREVLRMILLSLENTYNRKPSLHGTVKYFQLFSGWVPTRTKKAWEEVKNWWRECNLTPLRV